MTISPVHHTNLSVTDLERSIAFYRDVLGYRVTMRSPIERPEFQRYVHVGPETTGEMVMLQAGDDPNVGTIELVQWSPPPAEPTPPKRPGDPGVWLIAMQVLDETLEDVRERLREQGVEPWSDVIEIPLEGYPPFRGMVVLDPDGLAIELIQLPTREQVRAFRAAWRERQPA
jgi:catechol 2,3-dioxygenase-like lactoylglutathione lyase family enzyme